ncbi:hypothetical protein TNCV_2892431 [Trichonephila clavipes]|nr:hypothetical protein TNCV_2892431 [Trichonephila clavipes]
MEISGHALFPPTSAGGQDEDLYAFEQIQIDALSQHKSFSNLSEIKIQRIRCNALGKPPPHLIDLNLWKVKIGDPD